MRNSKGHVSGQGELSLGLRAVRAAVCTMLRWRRNWFLRNGSCVEGELAPVSYEHWLAFYTPLCERGQN